MSTTPTAKEVFSLFAKGLTASQGRYSDMDNMDIEKALDAAMYHIAKCIPIEEFCELAQFRLDGYGLRESEE